MSKELADIYIEGWENTQMGKRFSKMAFHMFTIDQLLSEYENKGERVIRMTLGKSDQLLSNEVKDAMKEALDYPKELLRVDSEGNPELRRVFSEHYSRRFWKKVLPQNVIVGSQGTSSLYRDIFTLLLQSGGKVLLPKPGYILYEAAASLLQVLRNDISIDYYNIDIDSGRIDIDSFVRAFDKEHTRIVVVNSPGNPIGNLVSVQEWESIIEIMNTGRRTVLFSDQVYSNMVFENKPYISVLDEALNKKIKIPYIVTDSMSKGYEMYTFRVGFAIVPDELVFPLTIFQRNFSLTPNTISQIGAIQALGHNDSVEKLREMYTCRYQKAIKELADISGIVPCPISGGFYLLVNCRKYIVEHGLGGDLELAMKIAQHTSPHIGVTPGSDFGAEGCIRISFSPSDFDKGIKILAEYLQL